MLLTILFFVFFKTYNSQIYIDVNSKETNPTGTIASPFQNLSSAYESNKTLQTYEFIFIFNELAYGFFGNMPIWGNFSMTFMSNT